MTVTPTRRPPSRPTRTDVHGEHGEHGETPPDEEYHEAAKAARATFGTGIGPMRRQWAPGFDVHVAYGAPITRRAGEETTLAAPSPLSARIDDVMIRRRSARRLGGGSVSDADAAALLWAAAGVQDSCGDGRTVPSGGGLYPIDVFAFCARVERVAPALYQYDPFAHVLIACPVPEPRPNAAAAVPDTFMHRQVTDGAALIIVLAGVFARNRSKYGQRALRYTLIEAGHAAQNVLLASAALDLAACPLGGFFDRELDHMLGLDGVDESALYAIAVGQGLAP